MSLKLSNIIRVGTEELETTTPVFNLTKPQLDAKEDKSNKNQPNGYAGLDENGKLPASLGGGGTDGGYGGGDLTVDGNILPDVTQTRDIGSETLRFRSIYVDDMHLSGNTLYLGDTPILGTNADTVVIKTDVNQHLSLQTTGIATTQMTSEKEVSVITTGMNADVVLQASGVGSKVRIGSSSPLEVTGNMNISGNITIGGNVTTNGTQFIINSTVVQVTDNIIVLNHGEVGHGVTAGSSGIRVDRGEEVDYLFVFDEVDDRFKIGKQDNLEIVATRPWCETNFAVAGHTHGAEGEEIGVVTSTVHGLMSFNDKIKLDTIETGAEKITKQKIETNLTGTIWTHSHPTVNGTLNFNNLLLVQDRKGSQENGGTFASGDWRTRDINTIVTNNIDGASLTNNVLTLPAGVYYVEIDLPANDVNAHVGMLYNVTSSEVLLYGTRTKEVSKISGHIVLMQQSNIEIRHRCETSKTLDGFGMGSADLGLPYNIFTVAQFWWIASESTYMEPGYVIPGYVE